MIFEIETGIVRRPAEEGCFTWIDGNMWQRKWLIHVFFNNNTSVSLSVCLSLLLRHIFVHTSHAIYFANSIHAVFTWRRPQSMKHLNDFYLIQTILSNIFAAHQSEVGDKSSPLCNGSLHFNHPHLNNPKVFPWILMAHMRKSSWWESKYWLEVKKNNNNVISKTDMNSFAVSSGFLLYRLRRGESDYQHGRLSRQPSR